MRTPCWSIRCWQPAPALCSVIFMLCFLGTVWGTIPVYAIPPAPHARIASAVLAAAQQVKRQAATTSQEMSLSLAATLEVYAYIPGVTAEHLTILQKHGVQVLHSQAQVGIVYAALPPDMLEPVALLSFVQWIGSPAYATRRRVTSEGDTVLQAAQARATFKVQGRGVRIGIISDSLTEIRPAIASGDLPAAGVTIVNDRDGTTVPGATNEGRALAEIIHDLAPKAELFFHSGFPTSMQMLEAINALIAAGVDIIVDDVTFLEEPVFADGMVAQAVQQAIANGIIYVTATGNSADEHYLALYQGRQGEGEELHDFGQGDTMLDVRVGGDISVFLQWPNPADGSANTADYDLFVVDTQGTTLGSSVDRQIGGNAPPRESVFVTNAGNTSTVRIMIKRIAGDALPLSLYFIGAVTLQEHNVPTKSIFGHPCVRGAIAVGAIDANLPAGIDVLEAFSSRGPCEILLPQRDVRTKPDVIATDGVVTSLTGFAPFFGTSAAAPHVAAIAALMLEAGRKSGAVSPTQIANTLRFTAMDGGTEGVDNSFGHGVVDALQAVEAIRAFGTGANTPPRSVIDDPAEDLVVPPQTLITFQGACIDAEDQQPMLVVWNFAGAAPAATTLQPGAVTFTTIGTFLVTLTCTDATGLSDPMPATRRIVVNTPPDSTITSPATDITPQFGSTIRFAGTCTDAEGDRPFTFLWDFGGAATIATSTQQRPTVALQRPGPFTVTLTCHDARGTPDPTPAFVRVTVMNGGSSAGRGDGDGSGGGCTLLPQAQRGHVHPLDVLPTVLLPLLTLSILQLWSRRKCQK